MNPRLLLMVLLLTPTLSLAQPEAAAEAAEAPTEAAAEPEVDAPKPPPGYEVVSGAGAAQVPIEAPPLVIISYLVIWFLTLLYLFYLWRRQAALKAEIDSLEARLRELDGPS